MTDENQRLMPDKCDHCGTTRADWDRFDKAVREEAEKLARATTNPAPEVVEALKICMDVIDQYHNYRWSGDPDEEDARAMGEMDIDYMKNDGRLEKVKAALKAAGVFK